MPEVAAPGLENRDPQAMCFGGGNDAAQEADRGRRETEAREAKRQADIGLGKKSIDKAFGKFDNSYYTGYQNDYTGYYNPQIDSQFQDAQGKLIAALAGRGTLESTVGASAQGKLQTEKNTARTGVANEAVDASNKLRGNVENTKTDLYALNQASADPQAMGARAVGQATSIVAPPPTSPLGQVFASFLQPYMNQQQAYQNRAGSPYSSPYGGGSNRAGSGRVIG